MDMGINNKGALILASSKGLGLGVAKELAAEGVRTLICGRNDERLIAASKSIKNSNYMVIDMKEKDSANRLYQSAKDALGRVDILINNSGGPPLGKTADFNSDTWRDEFETIVMRIIEITKLCIPDMQAKKWGRIVTIASSGVVQPIPQLALSNSLRSVLVGWSKTLATEYADQGITSNLLLPGRVLTDRIVEIDTAAAKRNNASIEKVQQNNKAAIPTGRYGSVEEFASIAVFLASARASYINGSLIRCDGGAISSI